VEPVVAPGAGETITARADRDLVIKGEHALVDVTESRYAPGERGPDPHVHHRHADAFYVLEGELTFGLGPDAASVTAPAGSLVIAPRDLVHTFANEGDADARFLNVHTPSEGFAETLRLRRDGREVDAARFDQHDPPADGGRPLSEAIVRLPGEADFVADRPGLSIRLLADSADLGVSLSRSDPESPSAPPHRHRRHVEWFYVVEGSMTFTVDGREGEAPAGSFVLVPPDTVHSFAFTGDEATTFLSAHAPSCGFGDFVRGLHAARTDDDLRAVRERFDQVPAA
jgi:quercetin dioxygenase-like cupin family protein